jgi:hypothetical protein
VGWNVQVGELEWGDDGGIKAGLLEWIFEVAEAVF